MSRKIILCGLGDMKDPKTWSGTPYTLYNGFQKRGISTGTINYNIDSKKFFLPRLLGKIVGKFVYRREDERDFFTSDSYEKNLLDLFSKQDLLPNDVLFHVTCYCIPKPLVNKVRNVTYVDSTLRGLMNFDVNTRPRVKWLIDWHHKKTLDYFSRLDHLFTQNEWSKKSLISDYNVDEKKITNIGFGVNLQPFHGLKDYTNKEIVIVLRKGVEKLKGLDLLLGAFSIVRQKDKDVKLNVVGTTYKQQEGVEYYENFPRSKTVELFQKASLYAMPALAEVNGITYLEALANRVPIIGLNRYAFPEFAGWGKYGFIVNEADKVQLADKIQLALSNPSLLEQMGKEGQLATLERFNWDRVINDIINIIG